MNQRFRPTEPVMVLFTGCISRPSNRSARLLKNKPVVNLPPAPLPKKLEISTAHLWMRRVYRHLVLNQSPQILLRRNHSRMLKSFINYWANWKLVASAASSMHLSAPIIRTAPQILFTLVNLVSHCQMRRITVKTHTPRFAPHLLPISPRCMN